MIILPVLITPSYANKLAHDRGYCTPRRVTHHILVHRRPTGCVAFQRFLSPVSFLAEEVEETFNRVFSAFNYDSSHNSVAPSRVNHVQETTCVSVFFFFSFFFFKVVGSSSFVRLHGELRLEYITW